MSSPQHSKRQYETSPDVDLPTRVSSADRTVDASPGDARELQDHLARRVAGVPAAAADANALQADAVGAPEDAGNPSTCSSPMS